MRGERRFAQVWLTAALVGTLGAFLININFLPRTDDPVLRTAATMREMRDLIQENYIEEVDDRELGYSSLRGMVSRLDPYSAFISPEELEDFEKTLKGDFGGLGIYVTMENGVLTVIHPLDGTPAFKSGILAGDRILSVDGESIKGLTLFEATRKLKGPVGTDVKLEILHPGETQPVEMVLTRAKIKIDSVKGARMLEPHPGIGYLRITQFHGGTVEEFRRAILTLKEQGMKKLVLDLRFNPGGRMSGATQVADEFLKQGVIVSTRGRNRTEEVTAASAGGLLLDEPVVVLVNRGSASAAEILAAALQDHRRALVIGMRSFGKGSVQTPYEIDRRESRLKLTTAHYYTPNGHCLHGDTPCKHEGRYCYHRRDDAELELGGLRPTVEVTMSRQQELNLRRLLHDREIEDQKHNTARTALYDTMIMAADTQLRRAIQYLEDTKLFDETIVNADTTAAR